jgi:hypothetical protein
VEQVEHLEEAHDEEGGNYQEEAGSVGEEEGRNT